MTPNSGLADVQSVSVSGAGFGANAQIFLVECKPNIDHQFEDCVELTEPITADANGNFGPITVTVRRTFVAPGNIPVNCLPHNNCTVSAFSTAGRNGAAPITFAAGGAPSAAVADFDGDGDTNVSVYRPSNSIWFPGTAGLPNTFGVVHTAFPWGTTGDIPVPANYDGRTLKPPEPPFAAQGGGEGPPPAQLTTDVAVFRPSNGMWLVRDGESVHFGTSGDIPVPGDYDNDSEDEVAVFRPSIGVWFIEGGASVAWGTSGDIPVPGDYNGDGTTDVAVFRPSSGAWFVNGGLDAVWGAAGDIPVPADYDGDGDTDIAVFRPSTGLWFVRGGATVHFGTSGDIPVPGDYRPAGGDGAADFAVFRPSSGLWFIEGGEITHFGTSGDVPLPLPDAIRRFFFGPL